jgi:hypothetical protein
MKKTVVASAVAAALLVPGTAEARGHWCRQGDPPIYASKTTDCDLAGNIVTAYANHHYGERTGTLRARSPLTHKTYRLRFRLHGTGLSAYVVVRGTHRLYARFSNDI